MMLNSKFARAQKWFSLFCVGLLGIVLVACINLSSTPFATSKLEQKGDEILPASILRLTALDLHALSLEQLTQFEIDLLESSFKGLHFIAARQQSDTEFLATGLLLVKQQGKRANIYPIKNNLFLLARTAEQPNAQAYPFTMANKRKQVIKNNNKPAQSNSELMEYSVQIIKINLADHLPEKQLKNASLQLAMQYQDWITEFVILQ